VRRGETGREDRRRPDVAVQTCDRGKEARAFLAKKEREKQQKRRERERFTGQTERAVKELTAERPQEQPRRRKTKRVESVKVAGERQ